MLGKGGTIFNTPELTLRKKGALSFRNILLLAGFEDRFRLRSVPLYWDLRRKTGGDQFQLVESRVSLAISGIHEREFNRNGKRMQKMLGTEKC